LIFAVIWVNFPKKR